MQADPQTEAEVMDTLNRFGEAYARGDINEMMSYFAPDADTTLINTGASARYVGLDGIRSVFENSLAQYGAPTLEFSWQQVSSSGSVAWVAAEGNARVKTSQEDALLPIRFTGVLEKRDGRWLMLQRHLSMPAS